MPHSGEHEGMVKMDKDSLRISGHVLKMTIGTCTPFAQDKLSSTMKTDSDEMTASLVVYVDGVMTGFRQLSPIHRAKRSTGYTLFNSQSYTATRLKLIYLTVEYSITQHLHGVPEQPDIRTMTGIQCRNAQVVG